MKSAGIFKFGTASAVRVVAAVAVVLGLVTAIAAQTPAPQSQSPAPAKPAAAPAPAKPVVTHSQAASPAAASADYNGVVKKYCVGCHNDRNKDRAGSLTLTSFDIAKAGQEASVAERMIRKLQASMMPPPGMPRPEPDVYQGFIRTLETSVDAHAKVNPNPGGRTFQRLNRPEYARAVHDLLELDIDPGKWLPLDTMSANFDNIADEQALSPTLLEAYLNAAADISRMRSASRARRRSIRPTPIRPTCRSTRGTASMARRSARAAAWSSTTCSPRTVNTSSR